jgi:catechol 2,3-dioxygenase-like lactoylglutathione lyase family enzyme
MTPAPLNVTRLDHINMRVKDLTASIQFYEQLFGFQMKEDHTQDGEDAWAIVGLANVVYICMYLHADKVRAPEALQIMHFGLVIDDFGTILERLQAHGVDIGRGWVQWPHSRSVYIKDPSGHEIDLTERVGGGLG